ncbi:hypothetical protein BKA67DRAFT_517891 [Truncatella angustata]|uniref:Transcription factor hoxa13 n=1 Tax=Truncatella angustata TaxID=152316 RepID=A0A9P8UMM3_9PEZI|nr:uncharacterized protein BKA67DRAFT_517891 [Truncatella angustata]KAH6654893.1 hypothetical protein BKA67DRAFT_517891 [Truncatella angustata]
MDGKANSHTNGSLNGGNKTTNGVNNAISRHSHSATPRRNTPSAKSNSSVLSRLLSLAARLSIWYSILTLLFRCPATLEACNETTPKVCKPYFQLKQAVTPHVTPYYDVYAAPYVDLAKPYYDTVDRAVVTPARTYAVKYGGPQLQKAQALGQSQWEKSLQPQLLKYQSLAKTQYDQTVAPHVNKASDIVAPYYDIARINAFQTYHELVVPSYYFVQPYALRGYNHASVFTTKTAVPSTLWAWNKTYVFLDSTVWPHVRHVYAAKVEPQLHRIGDRLGRYRGIKSKSTEDTVTHATQAVKSTFTKPSASIAATTAPAETTVDVEPTFASVPTAAESEAPSPTADTNVDETPVTLSKQEIKDKAAKEVADDLELWQGKFTKAADEGASEIEERIETLANEVIEGEVRGKGLPLVSELNTTVANEIAGLKKTILSILNKHKENGSPDQFEDEVSTAVRSAGLKIKDKAQGIRTWRESYEQQVEVAVTHAAQDHVRILESIRDLALQKIGMKWAWMDGVTYKHWQKFHELREKFDEWVEDLKRLVVTHPGLKEAQIAGSDVEAQGMAIAGEAARELASLKQVAAWKAVAGDYTDDFDASTTKRAAEAARQQAAEAAEAIKNAAASVQEGAQKVAGKLENHVKSASESVGEGVSSVIPKGTSTKTISADETVTATVSLSEANDENETSAIPALESLTGEPTHRATDLASDAAETETPASAPEATSAASEQPLPTSDELNGPEQIEEDIVVTPDAPDYEPPVQSATTTIKPALFGAAAQSVPSRQPILDIDTDDIGSSISSAASAVQSDYPHSITSAAQSAYTAAIAEAANQYSRALSAVSVQISGEPKPAHEQALSSVSSAYFGALAAANSRLNDAVSAGSDAVYGSSTTGWTDALPTIPSVPSLDWERVQSIAQQNFDDSIQWAGENYESAKVAIGLAEPTPSTAAERVQKLSDQAKHNYYAGLGVAHARYSEFIAAASTAMSSLTATPTPTDVQGSASSIASVATESAGSVVSIAGESVSSAAAAASDAASSLASSVGDATSNAGDSIAENWDYLVSQVSSQIYGVPTPTPWYENFYAAASDYAASATNVAADYASHAGEYAAEQYAIVASYISELIVGKEPTFSESVSSRLSELYGLASATAASAASHVTDNVASAASAAVEAASTATEGLKEKVENLRDEL